MGDRLATTDMGRKLEGCCAPFRGRAGSPSNIMSPGTRPTSVPSGILIRPAVWPQYTNLTDRQTDRQRSDSMGRTVLQTVAQKSIHPMMLSSFVRYGHAVDNTVERNCTSCHQQEHEHEGTKTLLQQNPPFLNWRCCIVYITGNFKNFNHITP